MPKKNIEDITKSIIERSKPTREAYLERIAQYSGKIARKDLGCANLAHTYASLPEHLKDAIKDTNKPNFCHHLRLQ
ncbi:Phosphogluconate dehydratase [Helicobacter bizzozeronii CCUG 35545]|nr:Phosphogluconate dehydratase [Helicobacter bizzozeronii CCUG 35545]